MEDLHHVGVGQERFQRRQVVDSQRVHDRGDVVGGQLDEAEPGEVGALSHEFGVDRDCGRRSELLDEFTERLCVRDIHCGWCSFHHAAWGIASVQMSHPALCVVTYHEA